MNIFVGRSVCCIKQVCILMMSIFRCFDIIFINLYSQFTIRILLMKLPFISILCIIFALTFTKTKIVSDGSEALPFTPEQFLDAQKQIELQSQVGQIQPADQETLYFRISTSGRSKKRVYEYFMKRQKMLVQQLTQNLLIPSESALIQSSIQISFVNKKRAWEVYKHFGIRINQNDHAKIQKITSDLKLTQLKYGHDLKGQIIKWSIMELFNSIKRELQGFIQKKYHGEVAISGLTGLQIQGYTPCQMQTQDLQLVDEAISRSELQNKQKYCHQGTIPKNMKMKARFRIGVNNSAHDTDNVVNNEEPLQIQEDSLQDA